MLHNDRFAPGMRIIVRGEEWVIKRVETNSLGNQTLQVVGISNLVKDYESRFMTDLEKDIEIVDPAKVKLIPKYISEIRRLWILCLISWSLPRLH